MTGVSGRPGSAGATVVAAVAAIALQHADASARAARGEPDAVHHARTLTRRLRSVLGANRRLFETAPVRRLRAELEVFGDELGHVRDLEARLEQAEQRLGGGGDADGVLRRRLVDEVGEQYDDAAIVLGEFLGGRGREMQHALVGFVSAPPFVATGGGAGDAAHAAGVLAGSLRAEARRVRRTARAVTGDLESLHRLRRAVRRLRYAAEAVSSPPTAVFGSEVRELAERARLVQDRLGAHRDEVLFAEQVLAIERIARAAGEGAGGYGELAAEAYATAAAGLDGLADDLDALRQSMRALRALPSGE